MLVFVVVILYYRYTLSFENFKMQSMFLSVSCFSVISYATPMRLVLIRIIIFQLEKILIPHCIQLLQL